MSASTPQKTGWRGLAAAASSALGLVLIVAFWLGLAPAQFGGQVSYVVVVGNSMEPTFHAGDLAVVRRADAYTAGDVTAYRHPDVGTIIHRIVDRNGERFILQGDNNSWLDSYQPTQDEMIGSLWLHLPRAGAMLQNVRAPWMLAVLGAVIGIVTLGGGAGGQVVRAAHRRGRAAQGAAVVTRGSRAASHGVRLGERELGWLTLVLAALAGSGVLAVLTHRLPLERTVLRDVTYEQLGTFSYAAPANGAASVAYDGGGAATGEPVFRRIASHLDVEFAYKLLTEAAHEVRGTVRVNAVVSDSSGWRRTVEVLPAEPFEGASFTRTARVELPRLQALLDAIAEETGIARELYQLAVVPEVTLDGLLAGQALKARFAPELTFRMDPLSLQLVTPAGHQGDPLKPAQRGLVKAPRTEPAAISLMSLSITAAQGRTISLVGLATALIAGMVVAMLIWRSRSADEAQRIAQQYGHLLVQAAGSVSVLGSAAGRVVELASMDDLARLAEREGRTILAIDGGNGSESGMRVYELPAGDLIYRFTPAPVAVAVTGVAPVDAPVTNAETARPTRLAPLVPLVPLADPAPVGAW